MLGAQIEFGQWHHLATTKSGNFGKVYLDGQVVGEGAWSGDPYSWGSFFLGAELYTGWDVFYHGLMDDLRLSSIVRSDDEILNSFASQTPHAVDEHTLALWRFDELMGSEFFNEVNPGEPGSLFQGAAFVNGRFGNGVYFDGLDDRADCGINPPENDFTIELWIQPLTNANEPYMCIMQPYGAYNSPMFIVQDTIVPEILWSTGDSADVLTVNPSDFSFVWVTDGVCTDTIWFDSVGTIYETVYDTLLISVVDTLVINITDVYVANELSMNLLKIYPNPASSQITIDFGDFLSMSSFELRIENSLGQEMYQTSITQQVTTVSLSTWSGTGLYFVYILNPLGELVEVKKIVLE